MIWGGVIMSFVYFMLSLCFDIVDTRSAFELKLRYSVASQFQK